MKTIIAGSRTIDDWDTIEKAIKDSGFEITQVVSGTAKGVDKTGEAWASFYGIPIKRFYPDWELFGKSAGMIRNKKMAEYADALIAIWDGSSKGTKNMIDTARMKKLKVYVQEI